MIRDLNQLGSHQTPINKWETKHPNGVSALCRKKTRNRGPEMMPLKARSTTESQQASGFQEEDGQYSSLWHKETLCKKCPQEKIGALILKIQLQKVKTLKSFVYSSGSDVK